MYVFMITIFATSWLMLNFGTRFIHVDLSSSGQNIVADADVFATNYSCPLCMDWIQVNIKSEQTGLKFNHSLNNSVYRLILMKHQCYWKSSSLKQMHFILSSAAITRHANAATHTRWLFTIQTNDNYSREIFTCETKWSIYWGKNLQKNYCFMKIDRSAPTTANDSRIHSRWKPDSTGPAYWSRPTMTRTGFWQRKIAMLIYCMRASNGRIGWDFMEIKKYDSNGQTL
jgi:hypothetical protein